MMGPSPEEVARMVADKLASGALRSHAPAATSRGLGSGRPCAVCERAIAAIDIECECFFRDGQILTFHFDCFTVATADELT
jgi:hypothetical protein